MDPGRTLRRVEGGESRRSLSDKAECKRKSQCLVIRGQDQEDKRGLGVPYRRQESLRNRPTGEMSRLNSDTTALYANVDLYHYSGGCESLLMGMKINGLEDNIFSGRIYEVVLF